MVERSSVYKNMFETENKSLAGKWFYQDQKFESSSVKMFEIFARSLEDKIFAEGVKIYFGIGVITDFLKIAGLFDMDTEKVVVGAINHANCSQYSLTADFVTFISEYDYDIQREINTFCSRAIESFSNLLQLCKNNLPDEKEQYNDKGKKSPERTGRIKLKCRERLKKDIDDSDPEIEDICVEEECAVE
jgi:hypothetical protein